MTTTAEYPLNEDDMPTNKQITNAIVDKAMAKVRDRATPMSNSKILTSEEVGEIEAQQVDRRKSLAFHQSEYPNLPTPSYIEEIDALCATVRHLLSENEKLKADVARFSELADKRHDQLWEARRQRDELAAKCAPYLETLK